MDDFLTYGEAHSELNPELLVSPSAKQTFRLVTNQGQQDFEIIELRYVGTADNISADIIVVDCLNDQVPTRNEVGIDPRERLALVFPIDESAIPKVYSLRQDFPATLHQNHVGSDEPPACLCLYFEPWIAVQRTWTPQKHLYRILWWLAETAKGTLHRTDQPLEQIYFDSPVKVFLPPDFDKFLLRDDIALTMCGISQENTTSNIVPLIGEFTPKSTSYKNGWPSYFPIYLDLEPIIQSNIERFPKSLGSLHDQLSKRGASIFDVLCKEVQRLTPPAALPRIQNGRLLLLINFKIKRTSDGPTEKNELHAFIIESDFTMLAESLGLVFMDLNNKQSLPIIGNTSNIDSELWRQFKIIPVEAKLQATKELARKASSVAEESSEFNGVLAGAGALGGVLADLWSREAWGTWTIIDPDHIEPHNIIRHIAKSFLVGFSKAVAVKTLLECNFNTDYSHVEAIPKSVLELSSPEIQKAIASASLFVDATTTLAVPREISQKDDTPRSVSLFLTPSGFNSVMLLEDSERQVRLESLEAQYYRAMINNDWGCNHLSGHLGNLWVGAGCRDVSAIISFELIQLHAATLARQVRIARDQSEPYIRIWQTDPDTGALAAYSIQVAKPLSFKVGLWRVLLDSDIATKLKKIRGQELPCETGGVILGYIDNKIKTIFVVDVLTAPPDSESTPLGFTRGIYGLAETLDEIARRTANIIGYIGEWHSHPMFYSAIPSSDDLKLIKALSDTLSQDGQPALMMIIGSDGEISVTVQESQ